MLTHEVSMLSPQAYGTLRERMAQDLVLSAYLDTSPDRTDGPAWLFALRDGCKAIRPTLAEPVAEGFEAAVEIAESYLTHPFRPDHPGLALFTTADQGGYAVPLPYRPVEGVVWTAGPRIEPLIATLDEFERFAVVLFDQSKARLFTIFLGEIEARQSLEDYVPRKQATGGWFGLAQTHYARHREDHVRRHVHRTIDALLDLQRNHPFDRLLISGPDEAVSLLRRKLPRPLRTRAVGTLNLELFADEKEILRAALALEESIERQYEVETVDELLEGDGLQHVALGVDATLTALGDESVQELLVSDTFAAVGAECQSCHRLLAAGARCLWCDAPTMPVADLREQIVRRALDQGATVEIVQGGAAERLQTHGGIGAWTRY